MSGIKPEARSLHTACCIAGPLTGQQHPLLLVIGGSNKSTLGDVWVLDVDHKTWNKVCIAKFNSIIFHKCKNIPVYDMVIIYIRCLL